MEGPFHFLLDNAVVGNLRDLHASEAGFVRIFDHFPSPAMTWWTAKVPLARNGEHREVKLRGAQFDLDLTTHELMEWLDDFEGGGVLLVQSERRLPSDLHPSGFRRENTYLNVLAGFGTRLVFSLPHANETAGVTLFSETDIGRIRAQGAAIREDPHPRQERWVWSNDR